MNIPASGLKLLLDGANVDGLGNSLLESGEDVPRWVQGTAGGCADFLSASYNGVPRGKPRLKENPDDYAGVAFDGVFNQMVSAGSAAVLAPVHTVGQFDLLLVVRKYGTSMGPGGTRHLFGNTGNNGDGLLVALADASLGEEGLVRVVMQGSNSGGGQTVLLSSKDIVVPVGDAFKILVRGDGANLQLSHDFENFESVVMAAKGGAPGADDYTLAGDSPHGPTGGVCFNGVVYLAACSLRATNWTPAELVALKTDLENAFGEGV